MQIFIPWLELLELWAYSFFSQTIPLTWTELFISLQGLLVWVRVAGLDCVWSVIFILGAWEQSPEIAQRHASVKC